MGWGSILVALAAAADIGALPPRRAADLDEPKPPALKFTSVTHAHQQVCPWPGRVCFLQAPGTTLRASTLTGPGGSYQVPIFFRAPPGARATADVPWDLLVVADLKERNRPGDVLIAVYDADDPAAIRSHEVTQLWTVSLPPFKMLAAYVHIEPSETAIRPTHTYLFRIVQLLGKREVLLAEGKVRLE